MSIYTGDDTPKVSNSTKGTNILERLLLSQYKDSPNLLEYYSCFITEVDTLFKSIEDTYLGMLLESAVGDQLDKIGLILGQDRLVNLPEVYFGFEGSTLSEGFSDDAAPQSGGTFLDENSISTNKLDDATYRKVLLVKAIVTNRDTSDINLAYYLVSVVLGRVPFTFRIEDLGNRDVKLTLGINEVSTNEALLIEFISKFFVPLGVNFEVSLIDTGASIIEAVANFNTGVSSTTDGGFNIEALSNFNTDLQDTVSALIEIGSYIEYLVIEGAEVLYAMDTAVGSTDLPDETGNGHDMVLNSGMTHEQAPIVNDTGYSILGTASTGNSVENIPLASGFTYQFWVRLATARTGTNAYVISRNNELDVVFNYGGANTFDLFANIIASVPIGSLQVVVPRDDLGHHVVMSYDKTTGNCKGYLDGVLVDTHTTTTNLAYQNNVRIMESYGTANPFKEEVDMLSMWDGALTDAKVAEHYSKGLIDWSAGDPISNVTITTGGSHTGFSALLSQGSITNDQITLDGETYTIKAISYGTAEMILIIQREWSQPVPEIDDFTEMVVGGTKYLTSTNCTKTVDEAIDPLVIWTWTSATAIATSTLYPVLIT